MFVSHRFRFIVFPNPSGSGHFLNRALAPLVDQRVGSMPGTRDNSLLFHKMTPQEAEIAFSLMGINFGNYTKIAIIENPFKRMADLYDRICLADPVWRIRSRLGIAQPTFGRWLQKTKADGVGAGTRFSPRWQRLGAWSADAWATDHIDHFLHADTAVQDLSKIFRHLTFASDTSLGIEATARMPNEQMTRYDAASTNIIKQRYRSDLEILHSRRHELQLVA
jgi:hypothetical protein